jgi:hypothetical protein
VFWQPQKMMAEKGVESCKVQMNGEVKAGCPLIGSVATMRNRFPLFFIAIESRVVGHHPFIQLQFPEMFNSSTVLHFYREYCIFGNDKNLFPEGAIEVQNVRQMGRAAPFPTIVWLFGDEDFLPLSSSKGQSMFTKSLSNKLIQT